MYTPTPGMMTSTSSTADNANPPTTTYGCCQQRYGMRLVTMHAAVPSPMPSSCLSTSLYGLRVEVPV